MRLRILTAVAAVLMALVIAPAAQAGKLEHKANTLRSKVVKKFGPEAAGRDIIRQGVRTKHGTKPAPHALKVRYVRTLDRTLNPPPPPPVAAPVAASSVPTNAPTSAPTSAPSGGSGGGGGYCGAYQFDQQTWTSVGGQGSPCGASQQAQDEAATRLQQQRGNQPWPVCGQGGASLAQIRACENGGSYSP